jgi:carboxymethylenebutenolidase
MRMLALTFSLLPLAPAQEPAPKPVPATAPKPEPGWTGVLDEQEFAALHSMPAEKAPKALGEMVKVGDATHYLALPKNARAPLPALLVIHEFWGLNDHIKHWTDRLAADGYAALAVDLYGGKVATTREEAVATMNEVAKNGDAAKATLHAALEFLAGDPRIKATKRGCLGWCFGGGWSLQCALMEPKLDAAVIYYGRLVDDAEQLKKIGAPVLGVFGNKDRGIPPASVDAFEQAMKQAGRDCRILRYDADHAFANPSGQRYDPENAGKAWAEVRAFLAQKLKDGGKPAATRGKSPGGR